ncbi:hypothetical protein K491DRAFT_698391 [Lophiostoma macrostomum CBS 122681]|uniref:Invertebrate defensins family profile domain-containing protein n=1 Tax=Lophiostoma macrostomum CBS 122681 TaxID=1314788 RepID=A0A6A6SNN0_9PLEO|nr:hypothetical protein K491DRAFT_698391 [Lophiostoma macrostomum CBS 122681]
MKFFLPVVSLILTVAMAAPSTNAEVGLENAEKRCLGAGAVTTNFNDCCSGQGYADRGCACTRCS